METESDPHVYSTPSVKVLLIIYDSKGKKWPLPQKQFVLSITEKQDVGTSFKLL